MSVEKISNVVAIRRYFAAEPHGRKVELDEIKVLDSKARKELGSLAAKELGVELSN